MSSPSHATSQRRVRCRQDQRTREHNHPNTTTTDGEQKTPPRIVNQQPAINQTKQGGIRLKTTLEQEEGRMAGRERTWLAGGAGGGEKVQAQGIQRGAFACARPRPPGVKATQGLLRSATTTSTGQSSSMQPGMLVLSRGVCARSKHCCGGFVVEKKKGDETGEEEERATGRASCPKTRILPRWYLHKLVLVAVWSGALCCVPRTLSSRERRRSVSISRQH